MVYRKEEVGKKRSGKGGEYNGETTRIEEIETASRSRGARPIEDSVPEKTTEKRGENEGSVQKHGGRTKVEGKGRVVSSAIIKRKAGMRVTDIRRKQFG